MQLRDRIDGLFSVIKSQVYFIGEESMELHCLPSWMVMTGEVHGGRTESYRLLGGMQGTDKQKECSQSIGNDVREHW